MPRVGFFITPVAGVVIYRDWRIINLLFIILIVMTTEEIKVLAERVKSGKASKEEELAFLKELNNTVGSLHDVITKVREKDVAQLINQPTKE